MGRVPIRHPASGCLAHALTVVEQRSGHNAERRPSLGGVRLCRQHCSVLPGQSGAVGHLHNDQAAAFFLVQQLQAIGELDLPAQRDLDLVAGVP